MLKGEIEILAAIALNKFTIKQITSARIAIHSPYIISTLDTLRQKKYIVMNKIKEYQITNKGIKVLAEFYPEHPTLSKVIKTKLIIKQSIETRKAIRMIKRLGNGYNIKTDYLQNLQDKTISD